MNLNAFQVIRRRRVRRQRVRPYRVSTRNGHTSVFLAVMFIYNITRTRAEKIVDGEFIDSDFVDSQFVDSEFVDGELVFEIDLKVFQIIRRQLIHHPRVRRQRVRTQT